MPQGANLYASETREKVNLGYLDGLRGILCVLVLIEHCINFYKPDVRFTELAGATGIIRRMVSATPLNIVYNGDMAVYIFFVLSGFVLSLSFNRTKNHSAILSGVIKRYPRIMLPVAGSMLFMYVIMWLTDKFIGQAFGVQFTYFIEQVFYQIPFTHKPLTNYPLWSMSYELYGSLLVFASLAIFGLSRYRLYFYEIMLVYFFVAEDSTYYALFIFGIILCDVTKGGRLKLNPLLRMVVFLAGLLLATTPLPRDGLTPYIGTYFYLKVFDSFTYMQVSVTAGVIGSMLLFTSVVDSKLAIKALSTRIIYFLGKISFPLYLTHATVVYVVSFILHRKYEAVGIAEFAVATAITVAISIPVAYIFERYVDVPSIRLSNKVSKLLTK
ncbi:acyltransferase family protein [Enterobacter asburiae]|uniref:acyltransferase family protein n=1 Tax=Enterobacter asburiae TaxID=61645 RepID=UPI0020044FCE|nr:acyltransferase [Enterobacter asburiae]MCK6991263.1 acyltransferase [Enterobacter asburiae]